MNSVDLIKKIGWTEWLVKTNYSFLSGASHPIDLIHRFEMENYQAYAINDYDGVYALARCHLEQIKSGAKGKLIHSSELRIRHNKEEPLLLQDSLVVLPKNKCGYKTLNQIINASRKTENKETSLCLEDFKDFSTKDLICLQPMRGRLRKGSASSFYKELKELFSDYYLCVSRHLHPAEDYWIKEQLKLSKDLNIGVLYSQDVFMHHPSQKALSDILHCIRTNKNIFNNSEHFFPNAERYPHSLEAIAKIYSELPDFEKTLLLSKELNEQVDFSFHELKYQYPKEMIPEGFTAQSYLAHLCWQAAKERFGINITEKMRQILHKELDMIDHLGFADYFLTVWDIVRWARSQGILCQGRGSAANSSVCFVLGVTSVDPNHFDLLFERFMSKERGDPPDIDVDFEHERREEVIQYIYRHYGKKRAAMVANVIRFRRKGALRAVGKALGIQEDMLSSASKLYSSKAFRGKSSEDIINDLVVDPQDYFGSTKRDLEQRSYRKNESEARGIDRQIANKGTLSSYYNSSQYETQKAKQNSSRHHPKARNNTASFAEEINEQDQELLKIFSQKQIPPENLYKHWQEMSEKIITFPRHLGLHSGGFIIAEHTIDELCPTEPASKENRYVVQWSKDDIEGLNFFKIDVLALGMLTAVRKSFDLIKKHYNRDFQLYSIPQEDPSTYSMIQKANTVGVFQIESRAQMSMLPRLKPKTFYDLVIEVAIIRPGPIQGGIIHPFLRRREGLEPVVYPDERLRNILSRTLGVIIFQEQAMRIAMEVGDFSAAEANQLRKNIGAWSMPSNNKDLKIILEKLARGMKRNNLSEEFTQQLVQQMKGFAEYGFPESHAISFAYIAYASSFLKCHYPAAFFCSVLNSQPMGFYSPHALLQAAQRDGCKIFAISLQHSFYDHSLEAIKGKEPPLYGIRLGFRLVKGLSKTAVEKIIEAREKNGAFKDFEDFLSRCPLYRDELTALAATNCFQIFGMDRRQALWLAEALPIKAFIEQPEKDLKWAKEASFDRLQRDFASFQTSLGEHPCQLLKKQNWPFPIELPKIIASNNFNKLINNQVFYGFGMVLVRQAPPSAKGMVFVTLEDEYGFINLALAPPIYQKYFRLVENHAFVCFRGKLQKQGESHSVLIKELISPKIHDNLFSLQQSRAEKTSENIQLKSKLEKTKSWIHQQKVKIKNLRELSKSRNYQ
ncbi:MAG: hypothetical protein CL674_11660 [Bdellovibrionaceae bacterium]|nr:hypothetical protein [Pseudobdellovibrionaceae bacterium]|tara:strand:- start:39343 stop:42903 length:3561 start_codon:yes stop_codon:yes gene_type:complete